MGVDQIDLRSIHTVLYMKEPKVNIVGLPSELFPVKMFSKKENPFYIHGQQ